MMKIAYLSSPGFADCDLPLLHELQTMADVTYILQVNERDRHRTLIDIQRLNPRGGLDPAASYPELQHLSRYIDMGRAYVLSQPSLRGYAPRNVRGYVRLASFLRREQFDIIHLTWPPRYTAFPLYRLRRRMIITMHDPIPHSSECGRMNLFHRRMAMRLIPRFVLLNEAQREEFVTTYKLRPEQVFQSQLGIYTHLQETQPLLPSGIAPGYVLFVGSISTHKGVEYLCEAMRLLQQQHAGLRLVVAGAGKLYFDAKPYEESGLLTLVNRYLSDEELAGLIDSARCVVCPYVDATQSGVVMSAFSLGVPVVATRVGGLGEMVADGRHGFTVPPRDSAALAQAIAQICLTPDTERQMRDNIRTDFSSGARSWRHIAEGLMEIYQQAET